GGGRAVVGGRQEVLGALVARADRLHLDAADRADLAGVVDRPGAGDELAAGQAARGELVVDAEREHQTGARAADVGELDVDGEREGVIGPRGDPDDGALLAAVVGGRGRDRDVPGLRRRRVLL